MGEVTFEVGGKADPHIDAKTVILRRSKNAPYYFIEGKRLPKGVIMGIDEQTSFYVDQYERMESFQAGLGDGKEHLLYKTRTTGTYYFPVGLIDEVKGMLDDFDIEYEVEEVDDRKITPIAIKWVSEKKLWPDQQEAVAAIMKAGGGTVVMPTGSGKTTAAIAVMARVKLKTLIVVNRKELLNQWKKAIIEALGVTPGTVGAGKCEWKDITVATIQTISRNKKDILPPMDMLILDECFPHETEVVTDGGILKIGDIVKNRLPVKVLTHEGRFKKIISFIKKAKPHSMVRVIHDFGNFECTENHRILTSVGWKKAKDLIRGDVIYSLYATGREDLQMQDMWKNVFYSGGGGGAYEPCTCSSGSQSECKSEVLGKSDAGTETCKDVGNETDGKFVEIRGFSHEISGAGDFRESSGGYGHRISEFKKSLSETYGKALFGSSRVCRLEIFDSKKSGENSSEARSQQGIWKDELYIQHHVDAGIQEDIRCLIPNGKECCDGRILVDDNTSDSIDDVVLGRWISDKTKEFGVSKSIRSQCSVFVGESDGRGVSSSSGLDEGQMGISVLFKQEQEGINIGSSQEGRSIEVPCSGECFGDSRLHEIQSDERFYVYDLEVEEDHSYTANGVVVHNCHHTPAKSTYSLALRCNAVFRLGLSATPDREDHAEMKIFAAVGKIVYTSKAEKLVQKERIAEPEFLFLPTSYPPGIHRGMPFHKVYTLAISANVDRNNRIIEIANKLLAEDHVVYIHVEEVAHGKTLAGRIPGAKFISGVTGKKEREKTIGDFSSGGLKCLCSTLLGEGVDIPAITAIIMAGGRKTEAGCIQKIGRALRITKTKRAAVIVDFMDKGVYISDHWQARYKAYKKHFGNYCPNLAMR